MLNELLDLIYARHRLISVSSADEPTEFRVILEAGRQLDRNVFDWSASKGIRVYAPVGGEPAAISGTEQPDRALIHLLRQKRPLLGCFRGIAPHTSSAVVRRLLRDYAFGAEGSRESLILIDEEILHPRVRRLAVSWRPGLPGIDDLRAILRQVLRDLSVEKKRRITLGLDERQTEELLLAMRGLSRTEAENLFCSLFAKNGEFGDDGFDRAIEAKRGLLENAGSLEPINVDFSISEVGGLNGLKSWLAVRRDGFTERARDFGIQPPRGVLMLGVPGCGKSLCAKAVAADWKMPLLRLDPGVLYQKYVGESENQLRQAIRQAEAMAPVVLWIDEIEKAFASASSASADGGLSQRMFGTLLSWMQDHREPIFIVATANDISALPAELMRKGRFDEVFFVDLPGVDARRQIFSIHLRRRRRNPAEFNLDELADASKDLTGSEIEQAIISALFSAFSANRQVTTADVLKAVAETRPLAVLMAERVDSLRTWAVNRCIPADSL